MKLTAKNYYSRAVNRSFMSVSQYKDFCKCEAMAMAIINGTYEKPKSRALFLGSLFDELLTGNKKSQIKFVVENRADFFQSSSKTNKLDDVSFLALLKEDFESIFAAEHKPYADVVQAYETAKKVKQQPLMMKYLSGANQKIMTGEIAGVPFKIKMDSYKEDEFVADLKYMASLRSPNLFESIVKYWGYDIQGSVYQEVVRQNTDKRLPFYLTIATKENIPHLDIAEVMQYDLDEKLEEVMKKTPRYQAIKNGEIEPERCEEYDCPYCTATRILTEPIDSNMLGMARKIDA